MKTRRFDFNYKPLTLTVSMSVVGSVPEVQSYDSNTDVYTPDYSSAPLSIMPYVSRIDRDGVLASGNVNGDLANPTWYEIEGGTRTTVTTSNSDYTLVTSGAECGLISMKRNVKPGSPVTLEFSAQYVDPRNSQVYQLGGSVLVMCVSETSNLSIGIDAADTTLYDPMRETDSTHIVTAVMYTGEQQAASGTYKLQWELYDSSTSAWRVVGSDSVMDYDVSVSSDTLSLTVDKSLMGSALKMRVRGVYDASGSPSLSDLTDASPVKYFNFKRRIAKFDYDMEGVPTGVPSDVSEVYPTCRAWDAVDNDIDFTDEFEAVWYVATNDHSGSLSYTQVGNGKSPTLSTSKMSADYGGVYAVDLKDRGAQGAWVDATDGAVLTDADGNILIFH